MPESETSVARRQATMVEKMTSNRSVPGNKWDVHATTYRFKTTRSCERVDMSTAVTIESNM